jgi:hypothetical protein
VNIAARLEGIAEPGGICISRQAHDHLLEKLSFTCEKLGLRNLKNIAKPVEVYSVNFNSVSMTQEIKYCRASDGVRLAYATVGQGPPLVKAANWMNHLEYDWESPIWHHLLEGLATNHTLVRYDARGNGLSDWDVDELSLEAWVSDLETVVDTIGIDRALSAFWRLPRLCHFHCLCRAASGAPYSLDPVWRFCAGPQQAITRGT